MYLLLIECTFVSAINICVYMYMYGSNVEMLTIIIIFCLAFFEFITHITMLNRIFTLYFIWFKFRRLLILPYFFICMWVHMYERQTWLSDNTFSHFAFVTIYFFLFNFNVLLWLIFLVGFDFCLCPLVIIASVFIDSGFYLGHIRKSARKGQKMGGVDCMTPYTNFHFFKRYPEQINVSIGYFYERNCIN